MGRPRGARRRLDDESQEQAHEADRDLCEGLTNQQTRCRVRGRTAGEQEARCRAQLEADGLVAGEVYIDLDESGGKTSRPSFIGCSRASRTVLMEA